jgi:hypothetical protein
VIDVDAYCRDLEAYLCRKNDGHLIRIAGPAFEQVLGWARQGIPLKIAEAGIDRYFERYYRKGPRRRPVRIEFCEADVLDAFDAWRRAVGVSTVAPDPAGGPDVEEPVQGSGRSKRSLASRIEGALARLTVLRGSDKAGPAIGPALDAAVRSLDAIRTEAARARGDAREALLERIADTETTLVAAAAAAISAAERAAFEKEADAELAPFRQRMTAEAYAQSKRAAVERLIRHHFGLPDIGR